MSSGVVQMPISSLNCPLRSTSNINKKKTDYRARSDHFISVRVSSVLLQAEENERSPVSKKIPSAISLKRTLPHSPLLGQQNVVGIIGGVSAFSTLVFLEKLVWWSSRNGREPFPFIVCSDPTVGKNRGTIVENLRRKRAFLEESGVGCLLMPCHISNIWHREVSDRCSVTFLNVADCVAKELQEASLKPLEAGSKVKVGILAADIDLMAGLYQDKLQNQGFDVVMPDKSTMEHMVIPVTEAMSKKDVDGAQTLLRIAIQVLLVKGVNIVIFACEEFQGLLPFDDPLLKKCIDPMDALARSTVQWACDTKKVQPH